MCWLGPFLRQAVGAEFVPRHHHHRHVQDAQHLRRRGSEEQPLGCAEPARADHHQVAVAPIALADRIFDGGTGSTVEDAVSKRDWGDGDLMMVGSSRLSAPKRLFLGSTAAKMLRVLDVPMMVVPRDELGADSLP